MSTELQRNALRSGLSRLAASIALVFALLFIPGGTLDWPLGWLFMVVFVAAMALAVAILWRANPDIFVARNRIQPGTKGWDYPYIILIITGFLAIAVLAGLDHRHGWAQGPVWVVVLGYGLFAIAFALQIWAQAVNRHFEPGIRIQTERGHAVIDKGPYGLVRHPGYVGGALLAVSLALALDSLVSLLPASVVVLTLIARTRAEDKMLQRELPGYADYALRVRHKWVPGLW